MGQVNWPWPKPPPWWWLLHLGDDDRRNNLKVSKWFDALIDISEDDDLTPEIDLGEFYAFVQVVIPTITGAKVSLQIGTESGGTYKDLHEWKDADADNTVLYATADDTGDKVVVFFVGAAQFLKVKTSAGQAADRTLYVRGVG